MMMVLVLVRSVMSICHTTLPTTYFYSGWEPPMSLLIIPQKANIRTWEDYFQLHFTTMATTIHPSTNNIKKNMDGIAKKTTIIMKSNEGNKARVLLVGTGTMGKIRAPLLYSNPKFVLCGICDEFDYQSAADLASQYSTIAFHTIDEAIFHYKPIQNSSKKNGIIQQEQQQQHYGIDGVIISVRTEYHAQYIEAAAKHGLKAIFVEKPISESPTEICRLFDLCDHHEVQLCCGFQRRFDASYRAAATACQSGQIGKPLSAHIFFGDSPCPPIDFLKTGGNIFSDLAVHDVDFIRYALDDDVASVFATATYSSKELEKHGIHDNATMVMMFKKGAMVTLTLSRWSCYGYDQRCEIFGDKGMVSVGSQHTTTTVVYNNDGEHHSRLAESYPQRFYDAFTKELDAFANTILDEDNSQQKLLWPVTKTDAIAVQAIAQAADQSCKSKCVVDVVK